MPLANWPRPNYITATPAAGFSQYSPPTWAAMGYFRDAMGFVHLRGLFAFSPLGSYVTWDPTSVPAGFYSSERPIFACIGNYSGGNLTFRLDVVNNGVIEGSTASGVNWQGDFCSLNGQFQPAAV